MYWKDEIIRKWMSKNPLRAYKGSSPAPLPSIPSFQGGIYKIGGDTRATTKKEDNNIVSDYILTDNERKAFDTYQSALPSLAKNAVRAQDFGSYADAYKQNQLDNFNRSNREAFGNLAYDLGALGYNNSSTALEKVKPFAEAQAQTIADIEAQAPITSMGLRDQDLAYNTNLLNNATLGINNVYDTGNTFTGNATNLSKYGNDWTQQNYQNQLTDWQINEQLRRQAEAEARAKRNAWIKAGINVAGIAAAPFTGGTSLALASGANNLSGEFL
jgi:hypothetical protein